MATYSESDATVFCTIKEGQTIFRMSRNKLNEVAEKAEALITIGRMKRIDMEKLKAYLSKDNDKKINAPYTNRYAKGTIQESFYHDGIRHTVEAKTEENLNKKFVKKYKEVVGDGIQRISSGTSNDDICYQVYFTTDYDKFIRLLGNRELKRAKISKLKKNILKYGWLRNPILVNEKFEIIDGQHRYEALKELGYPIEYIVDEGTSLIECQALNLAQANWNQTDYIRSYAENNIEDYIYLNDLINKYEKIGINTIFYAICDLAQTSTTKVQAGEFKCTKQQYEDAKKALDYLYPLIPCIKKLYGRVDYLQTGIIFIFKHEPMCDLARLKKRIMNYTDQMTPPADVRTALKSLEELYNKQCRSERMYFENDYERFTRQNKLGTKHGGKH